MLKNTVYRVIVSTLVKNYENLDCNISLKVYFLDSYMDFFHERPSDVSDEHGERFHQDMAVIEKLYKGRWSQSMLADYCWKPARDHLRNSINGKLRNETSKM